MDAKLKFDREQTVESLFICEGYWTNERKAGLRTTEITRRKPSRHHSGAWEIVHYFMLHNGICPASFNTIRLFHVHLTWIRAGAGKTRSVGQWVSRNPLIFLCLPWLASGVWLTVSCLIIHKSRLDINKVVMAIAVSKKQLPLLPCRWSALWRYSLFVDSVN